MVKIYADAGNHSAISISLHLSYSFSEMRDESHSQNCLTNSFDLSKIIVKGGISSFVY